MSCLDAGRIYLYLEDELPSSERKAVEIHLAACSACRRALEERRFLLEAVNSLPEAELPADFSKRVMRALPPLRNRAFSWLTGAASMAAAGALMWLTVFLLSGDTLSKFLIGLNDLLWTQVRSFALIFVKTFKLVSLLLKLCVQFSELLFKGFTSLTTILSPEVQALLLTITIVLSAGLFLGARRIIIREKQHDS